MAMNLGVKTPKLFIDISPTNDAYANGFNEYGEWIAAGIMTEDNYIDLGTITDEREELTLGGIAYSMPGTGTDQRVFWAVGGKVLRVTLSGIIPDGIYVGISKTTVGGSVTSDSITNGHSNSSVFKYKLNKLMAYQNLTNSVLNPHVVRYRRSYLYENNSSDVICNWVITSYSIGFIQGTRNIQYTISLDQSQNVGTGLKDGIRPRLFGDIR